MTAYVYRCQECEDDYCMTEKGNHLCTWVECDNDKPMEFVREEST